MPGWSLGRRLFFGQAHLVGANAANRISASSLKADLVDAEQVAAMCQEETSSALLIERATNSEADDVEPVRGCASAAIGGADFIEEARPGTAAKAMLAAIPGHPCRAVDRCLTVVLVRAILDPLPDIANHVMETELVWPERADRSRLRGVPLAAAAGAIGIIGASLVSPGIDRLRPSARGVLVFRFTEQPVGFAGDLGEPCHVALCIVPIDVDHRLAIPSPAVVVDMRDAITMSSVSVPLGESNA